jgi:probable phosphoglycerate mutase
MTTILYLIRHGETDWNAAGRWQGHADVPLNERGKKQSELLAQHLQQAGVRFDAIYSSDLTRAYQTAWEIGSALRVAVQLLPPLREIDLGYWSGLSRADIKTQYPVEYRLLEQGQDIPRGGAETATALYRRVTETVKAMVDSHPGETLALVSHGGSIRSLLKYVDETYHGNLARPREHLGNTSVTVLHCESDTWKIVTYNDMQHLENDQVEAGLAREIPDDAEQL